MSPGQPMTRDEIIRRIEMRRDQAEIAEGLVLLTVEEADAALACLRGEAWQPDAERLRTLIAKWRETADIWDQHNNEYRGVPKRAGYEMAPQCGVGAIKNWINWLRNCAKDAESCLPAPPSPTVDQGDREIPR
jgi:hypothetical protein